MRIHLRVWRQAGPNAKGRLEHYTAEAVSPDMSFLEMLDVVNEQLIKKGEEPDRVRLRLPRRHLRHVRHHGQRPAPRPGTDDDRLPVAHAPFQGRRHDHARALAGQGVSGPQGPGGGPQRVRSNHPGRRLHVGQCGRRAGWQRRARPQDRGRSGDGRRPVHRLRRLCRRVQERVGGAVHVRQGLATWRTCPRARSNGIARVVAMVDRMDAEGFGSCSNEGECEAVCPKGISLRNIATMNREYMRALVKA